MSARAGYFDSFQTNGGMWEQRKISAKPRIDRLFVTPTPRPERGANGVQPGAEVIVSYAYDQAANRARDIGAQVWAAAESPYLAQRAPRGHYRPERGWWVVTREGRAYFAREDALTVVGQCADTPLFEVVEQ